MNRPVSQLLLVTRSVENRIVRISCPARMQAHRLIPAASLSHAMCEVGGSTPGLSYGDLGIIPWGRPKKEIVHQQETKQKHRGRPLPIRL